MPRRSHIQNWERFAAKEPYFAVLTDPHYQLRNLTPTNRENFFATGFQYVDFLFDSIQNHLDKSFRPTVAVEFGCGVGRVLVGLSRRVDQVIAVDVSRGMLDEARRNCSEFGAANVEFLELKNFLEQPASADLVNAYIVFQHVPVREGEKLYRTLISCVRPGGVVALHFVYGFLPPFWDKRLARVRAAIPGANFIANLLRGKPPSQPSIQMHKYNLNRVFAALQANGYGHSYNTFTDHGGYLGMLVLAQRIQRHVP